jgi:hypothetical protein
LASRSVGSVAVPAPSAIFISTASGLRVLISFHETPRAAKLAMSGSLPSFAATRFWPSLEIDLSTISALAPLWPKA